MVLNLPLKRVDPPGILTAWDAAENAGFTSPAPDLAREVSRFTHADRLYLLGGDGPRSSQPQWDLFREMCARVHGVTNGGLAVGVVHTGRRRDDPSHRLYVAVPRKGDGVWTWRSYREEYWSPKVRAAVQAGVVRRSVMVRPIRARDPSYDTAMALADTLGALYVPWVRPGTPVYLTFRSPQANNHVIWRCSVPSQSHRVGAITFLDYRHTRSDWWIRVGRILGGCTDIRVMYGEGLNPQRFAGDSLQAAQAWIMSRTDHHGNTPPEWTDIRRGP